jgi:hypothetical protein
MKLLFLLLFLIVILLVIIKTMKKLGFAYGKKMLIFYWDRISRINIKVNKDIQLKIFIQADNKIINQNLK